MNATRTTISKSLWGEYLGKTVWLFRLSNSSGSYVEITNYGATLVSVVVPDQLGQLSNIILGYDSLNGYLQDECYIGSTIGRFANRIGNATFELDGVSYKLDRNDGHHTNHGGKDGFHAKVFDSKMEDDKLVLTLYSSDGEGGFPGSVLFQVIYSWDDRQALSIKFIASSNKRTVVNFTNHAYFNLTGDNQTIHHHRLSIDSKEVLEATGEYIPTGAILQTKELQFNGQKVEEKFTTAVANGLHGLNTYYVFNKRSNFRSPVCVLRDEQSGRMMKVFSSYPGVQVYTGDFLSSDVIGNKGRPHRPFDGICLECQHFPDSPNHTHFPSTVIEPGKPFSEFTTYHFSTTDKNNSL